MATSTNYELSKTYRYRKVMKPLLERKRRARINQCLDELKDLIGECVQQQQSADSDVKLEKADILELTVQHLRKLRTARLQKQQQQQQTAATVANSSNSFRAGYIKAAHEISRCLASLPNVDVALGTKLMTQLGMRLNQLESQSEEVRPEVHVPLSINCAMQLPHSSMMHSPVSSGYASDTDSAYSSPTSSSGSGLLQMAKGVWRPW